MLGIMCDFSPEIMKNIGDYSIVIFVTTLLFFDFSKEVHSPNCEYILKIKLRTIAYIFIFL